MTPHARLRCALVLWFVLIATGTARAQEVRLFGDWWAQSGRDGDSGPVAWAALVQNQRHSTTLGLLRPPGLNLLYFTLMTPHRLTFGGIVIKVDDNEAVDMTEWPAKLDHNGATLIVYVKPANEPLFIPQLLRGKRVRVRYWELNGKRHETFFSLNGAGDAFRFIEEQIKGPGPGTDDW